MVISLITVPITTRLLLPEEFGKSALFTVGVSLLIRLVLLGADQSFVRKYFEQPNRQVLRKLLWNSLYTPLVLGAAVLLLIYAYRFEVAQYLIDENDLRVSYMLMATTIVGFLEMFSINVVRMAKKAVAYSIINILRSLVNVGGLITYALLIEPSFYAIIYSVFLGHLVCLIYGIWIERDIWRPQLQIDWSEIKELLSFGMPYVPTFLLIWLLQGMDKIAIKQFSDFQELGLYNAAFKLVAVINVAKVGFIDFWIPTSLEHFEKNRDDRGFFARMALMVSFIAVLLSLGVLAASPLIINLLGTEYQEALYIMPFLLFVPIMNLFSELTGRGIGFMKRTKYNMYASFMAVVVNLGLNYALVPKLGAVGAATATAAAYYVFFVAKTYFSQRLFSVPFPLLKMHIALLLMAAVSSFLVIVKPGWLLFTLTPAALAVGVVYLFNRGDDLVTLRNTLYKPALAFLRK